MANEDEATNGAGSGTCSGSSNSSNKSNDVCICGAVDDSCEDSSSHQSTSDAASGGEVCLKKKACLKQSRLKSSSRPESSDGQSSICSAKVSCKSDSCSLVSKGDAVDSASESEAAESTGGETSSDAQQSENSAKEQGSKKSKKEYQVKSSSKKNATAGGDASGWSLSEDALLRSMKEANDGLSWDDIGKSLNRSKSECKSRWKTIKDQPPSESKSEGEPIGDGEQAASATTTTSVAEEGKTSPAASAEEQETTNSAQPALQEKLTEEHHQRQYWHEHIGRHLYPRSIRVEPDAHFSQTDCRVLEMIDARYQTMRWLETQARFYNETGRMVPLQVIRRKCEEAVARTEADVAD